MKHSEELLAVWRAKITSADALNAAINRSEALGFDFHCDFSEPTRGIELTLPDGSGVPGYYFGYHELWPASRDKVREHLGIYEPPSSVLLWLRQLGKLYEFPHVSREDVTKVAFSPDTNAAINDTKVRTTIGKLLRKLLPMLTDDQVASLSAMHVADMDPTFNVARTPEDIEKVYTRMRGDTGCMRYPKSDFDHETYHPSAVYSSPGFGVAYTGTLDSPTARSVIYDNPDDPSDKRFVRIYGAPTLANKLKRAGYRCAGLAGARLTKLFDASHGSDDCIVMPYIDPAGGRGAGVNDCNAQRIVAFKGDDFVTLIDDEQYNEMARLGLHTTGVANTCGHVDIISNRDRGALTPTDCATGEPIDLLRVGAHRVAVEIAGQLELRWTAAPDFAERYPYSLYVEDDGNLIEARFDNETYATWRFPHSGGYAATPATIKHLGYFPLDPARYGPRQYSVYSSDVVSVGDTYVRRNDTLVVYAANDDRSYLPADEEARLRDEGYAVTPNRDSMKVFSHPDNPGLVTLVSGCRAIRGLHDIVELWDGQWCMRESSFVASVFGVTHRFQDEDFETPAAFWEERARSSGMPWPYTDDQVRGMLRKSVKWNGYSSYVPLLRGTPDDRRLALADMYSITTDHTTEALIEAAEWIVANPEKVAQETSTHAQLMAWARCAISLVNAVKEAREAAPATSEAASPSPDTQPTPAPANEYTGAYAPLTRQYLTSWETPVVQPSTIAAVVV